MKYLEFFRTKIFLLRRRFLPSKKPFVCVAIGDSTVEGIGATSKDRSYAALVFASIRQNIKNAQYYNLGISGARVEDVLSQQLKKAVELNPDIILVSIGANDLIQKRNPKQFEKDFRLLIEQIHNQTHALVVVNNIPDITLLPSLPKFISPYASFLVKQFNQKIDSITTATGTLCIDLYTQSKLYKGYKDLIGSDGFHPSDLGYALWANTIITKIGPTLGKL